MVVEGFEVLRQLKGCINLRVYVSVMLLSQLLACSCLGMRMRVCPILTSDNSTSGGPSVMSSALVPGRMRLSAPVSAL